MGVWPTINSNVNNTGKMKVLRHTKSKFETSLDHTSGSHEHFKLCNTKVKESTTQRSFHYSQIKLTGQETSFNRAKYLNGRNKLLTLNL